MEIKQNQSLYHLSYDIKDSSENANEKLKRDIVWEILIDGRDNIIISPCASTLVFESNQDFQFWQSVIRCFSNRMYYVFSEVKEGEKVNEDTVKMNIEIYPDRSLDDNFEDKLVEQTRKDFDAYVKKTGKIPKPKSSFK